MYVIAAIVVPKWRVKFVVDHGKYMELVTRAWFAKEQKVTPLENARVSFQY